MADQGSAREMAGNVSQPQAFHLAITWRDVYMKVSDKVCNFIHQVSSLQLCSSPASVIDTTTMSIVMGIIVLVSLCMTILLFTNLESL